MKQENDIPDKILERIRKLVRLKESTTSEGEAKAAATHVNRLLKEYNLSLLDVNEKRPETVFEIRESGAISYKDSFGNYWKRDLLRVLCEYNYCRMLRYRGTTDMLIVGTQENIAAVTVPTHCPERYRCRHPLLRIIVQVCRTIYFVHERDVLHPYQHRHP